MEINKKEKLSQSPINRKETFQQIKNHQKLTIKSPKQPQSPIMIISPDNPTKHQELQYKLQNKIQALQDIQRGHKTSVIKNDSDKIETPQFKIPNSLTNSGQQDQQKQLFQTNTITELVIDDPDFPMTMTYSIEKPFISKQETQVSEPNLFQLDFHTKNQEIEPTKDLQLDQSKLLSQSTQQNLDLSSIPQQQPDSSDMRKSNLSQISQDDTKQYVHQIRQKIQTTPITCEQVLQKKQELYQSVFLLDQELKREMLNQKDFVNTLSHSSISGSLKHSKVSQPQKSLKQSMITEKQKNEQDTSRISLINQKNNLIKSIYQNLQDNEETNRVSQDKDYHKDIHQLETQKFSKSYNSFYAQKFKKIGRKPKIISKFKEDAKKDLKINVKKDLEQNIKLDIREITQEISLDNNQNLKQSKQIQKKMDISQSNQHFNKEIALTYSSNKFKQEYKKIQLQDQKNQLRKSTLVDNQPLRNSTFLDNQLSKSQKIDSQLTSREFINSEKQTKNHNQLYRKSLSKDKWFTDLSKDLNKYLKQLQTKD